MKQFIRSLFLCAIATAFVFLHSCGTSLPSNSLSNDTVTNAESQTEASKPSKPVSDGLFHAVLNYAPLASVVYSERASADEIRLAQDVADFIHQKTGVSVQVKNDYVAKLEGVNTDAPEILIGLTNRPDSISLKASLKPLTFAIDCTENKLAIVGSNIGTLSLAVDFFKESFLSSEGISLKKGELSVASGTKYVSGECEGVPKNLLSAGTVLAGTLTPRSTVAAIEEMRVIGGVCTDGEYLYAVMRQGSIDLSTMSYKSVVAKYSLSSFELVSVSSEYDIGLGADMDYDPVSDRLVILHASSQGKEKISYMTTGLLNLTDSVNVPEKMCAICSDKKGGFFAVSADGNELLTLDANLSVKSRADLLLLSGDVSAITTDSLFIYVLTNARTMVNAYATDGTYVNRVSLDTPLEAKNIVVIDDRLYVGFCDALWSKGELYELTLSFNKE